MRTLVRVLAGLYLAYIALAVLVAMPALNFLAPWYMKKHYDRALHSDIILFNPFTLSAEIRGASLDEAGAGAAESPPFIRLDRATLDLSLKSLLGRAVVLDEVAVAGLEVNVRRVGEQQFNFSDLLPQASAEQADGGAPPGLTVEQFSFAADRVAFADQTRDPVYRTYIDGIDIQVSGLSTVTEGDKPYRIKAAVESGGELSWEGTVSVPAARSEGSLQVKELNLLPFWRFGQPWLNLRLADGSISLSGDYSIAWGEELRYAITNGRSTLADIDIVPKNGISLAETAVAIANISVDGIRLDSDTRSLAVARVSTDGLAISGWSEGSRASVAELFAVDFPATASGAAAETDRTAGDKDWRVSLEQFELGGGEINWRSEYTDPPKLHIAPLELRASSLNFPPAGPSPLAMSLQINSASRLALEGAVALADGRGELDYRLEQLPLAWFNPNLPSALKARINDGKLGVSGRLELAEFLPRTIAMDGSISNFSGSIEEAEEAITSWDTVRWEQLEVDVAERSVDLARLLVDTYQGRVHIAEDGSINASRVWQEEVGEQAEQVTGEPEADQPWKLQLAEIFITESAIDFKDASLPIPFRTMIGDVDGQIINLSTEPGTVAEVDIEGSVDGYAPVLLKGTAAGLATSPALDLGLSFTGVDLVLLTPYSGTYAGYAIEQGLLNLDLRYSLDQGRLVGANAVHLEQLKLGEKVESDKAVDLPLELALALLTDINGVIDLDLPVEGDINDPKFKLGSVIASALVNLVTKAATAPFALLANLVGSDEDFQRLPFAAGSADLAEANKQRLAQLRRALSQRPSLILVIQGKLNPSLDREQLQRALLREELLSAGVPAEEIDTLGPGFVEAIDQRYRALGGSAPDASLNSRYQQVVGAVPVGEQQLNQLALDRGAAVKDHLVNALGLAADRAVIAQAAPADRDGEAFSGVELELDY